MSARLREIARRNEQAVAEGGYELPGGGRVAIGAEVARAAAATRLHGPEPVRVPAEPPVGQTEFEVTGEDSLVAARRLAGAAPDAVAVLNFASARNPGGGYLTGARAQEEALCRSSALYTCLLRVPEFYAAHRADRSPFYSDRVIHSPAVPVFRDASGRLLERPYPVGFLTAAAPNAGVIARRDPAGAARVPAALATRSERVLEVAAAHGYRRLVLGAWGCGVFRNDPAEVAAAFAGLLLGQGRFAGRFEQVVFAVLDRRAESANRAAFAARFGAGTGLPG